MATWADFAAAEPELAQRVLDRFNIRKHKTLATLRSDGSPRISGIETQFEEGEVYLGMMPRSVKALDLLRDPRLALHSPTEDAPEGNDREWQGEAKISGRAVDRSTSEDGHRFSVDIEEVVWTHLNEAADRLVVESWHEGRGRSRIERT